MVTGTERTIARRFSRVEFAAVALRAGMALERADQVLRRTQQLIEVSRALRDAEPAWPRYFVVHGRIEAHAVRASWFRGELYASPLLSARAQLLVAMGETFTFHDTGEGVVASLDDPLAAMLTMIRACDRLDDAQFGPVGPPKRIRSASR